MSPVADRTRTATAYLQIAPHAPVGGDKTWDRAHGWGASIQRVTNHPPETPLPDCVVVKVVIEVPAAAWEPLVPEAKVTVPLDAVQRPISVQVEPVGESDE